MKPHFRVVVEKTPSTGVYDKILFVDEDGNETDVSNIMSGFDVRCRVGDVVELDLHTPFAKIDVVGYVPDAALREFASLGKMAERILESRVPA